MSKSEVLGLFARGRIGCVRAAGVENGSFIPRKAVGADCIGAFGLGMAVLILRALLRTAMGLKRH